MGPKNGGFGGKWGVTKPKSKVSNLRFWFRDPQQALSCAEPRRSRRILRQNRCTCLGCSLSQEPPPPKKVAESLCAEGREITHAQNRNL